MVSAARRCDPAPRSAAGTCALRWPCLRRHGGGRGLLETAFCPRHRHGRAGRVGRTRAGQGGSLLWAACVVQGAEVLHGHSWSLKDVVNLQAACSSGLLIPRVLWVTYLGSPSTSALLAARGKNQQLVLVLVTQPMSSHPCPCASPCRHQSIQAHAKEAHTSLRSLHTSPGGFFPAGFACPGLVPQF